ncbi:serine/threonine-protein kinase [Nonomuraea endophytica]|uniref:non-specific serine/threonine protein kinase n=1 Tax=Nonomuraea endophytica TaxID=714136 RepID=A0A7W8A2P7_9ACTN|nr:serine/threonine-protein kinase [Nonomuraea endophytica]MBB5078405.1 tRNA A-37 threonylcarbamoyl transferase component Bud32 [Nonomuraea endophytica]
MSGAESAGLLAGRYRLLSQLGQGGMGIVWLALDELLRQEVAVKEVRLPPDLDAAARAELSERTLREARAAARLRSHPAIVTVHDVVLDGGRPWIVMELVRGRSLDRALREHGPLPPRQVAAIGARVLEALAAAHASGILHRDVKPANVMLTDDGRVLLTDFGIASVADDAVLTQTGLLTGSPGYIAPERLRGEADGPLADLWSLGATLFAAVEGTAPFARQNPAASMAAVLMQEPPPARRAGPLAPVLAALLEKDPARRCSPAQAADWLNAAAQGAPATAGRRRAAKPPRRRKAVILGAALAVALAGTATVVVVTRNLPGLTTATGGPTTTGTPAGSSRKVTSAPKLFTRDVDSCKVLNAAEVGELLGPGTKRRFVNANSCAWERSDGTYLGVTVIRYAKLAFARDHQTQMVKSMKDTPKITPGTKLHALPKVGEGSFMFTQYSTTGAAGPYRSQFAFRLANVVVLVVHHSLRRSGHDSTVRAAKLLAKNLRARQ